MEILFSVCDHMKNLILNLYLHPLIGLEKLHMNLVFTFFLCTCYKIKLKWKKIYVYGDISIGKTYYDRVWIISYYNKKMILPKYVLGL